MKNDNSCYAKLSTCNLAIAVGLVWGISMMLTTYLSLWFDYGTAFIKLFSSIYIGLTISYGGGLVALVYGFIDGAILGALIALIYNFCLCNCPCPLCRPGRKKRK